MCLPSRKFFCDDQELFMLDHRILGSFFCKYCELFYCLSLMYGKAGASGVVQGDRDQP